MERIFEILLSDAALLLMLSGLWFVSGIIVGRHSTRWVTPYWFGGTYGEKEHESR